MKVWGITICKTHVLEFIETKIADLTDRLQKLEYLRLEEIDCPTCKHKTIARHRYYNECKGGLYCYGCGNVFEKSNTALYIPQK